MKDLHLPKLPKQRHDPLRVRHMYMHVREVCRVHRYIYVMCMVVNFGVNLFRIE